MINSLSEMSHCFNVIASTKLIIACTKVDDPQARAELTETNKVTQGTKINQHHLCRVNFISINI
jgi:hypothetical protein